MIRDKPIHIILRVDKEDVDKSIAYWSDLKDYIWWSYVKKNENGKAPIADSKKELLNENINRLRSSLVYFCDDRGRYVKKAMLLKVEGNGTKSDETNPHVPEGWGGKAALWLKCDGFENGSLDDLKSLALYSDPKISYINLNPSRKLFPFAARNPVNLVIEMHKKIKKNPKDFDEEGKEYLRLFNHEGGPAEDEPHLQLKKYVAQNPGAIGLSARGLGIEEFSFISGDECDIVFELIDSGSAVVEIKVGIRGELIKGIYQAIKYRALMVAQKGHGEDCPVRALLVAYSIPNDIARFASKFGVECMIVDRELVTSKAIIKH